MTAPPHGVATSSGDNDEILLLPLEPVDDTDVEVDRRAIRCTAACTAALYLARQTDRYEVSLYTTGFRLGGKCQSWRNPDKAFRIEEHGLHAFLGFYRNAFTAVHDAYVSAFPDDGLGEALYLQAFHPEKNNGVMVFHKNVWTYCATPNLSRSAKAPAVANLNSGQALLLALEGALTRASDHLDAIAEDHPLLGVENALLTPHLGASTSEAQERVAVEIAQQVAEYLKDNVVKNAVNVPALPAETAEGETSGPATGDAAQPPPGKACSQPSGDAGAAPGTAAGRSAAQSPPASVARCRRPPASSTASVLPLASNATRISGTAVSTPGTVTSLVAIGVQTETASALVTMKASGSSSRGPASGRPPR